MYEKSENKLIKKKEIVKAKNGYYRDSQLARA